jgi:hypothetical protein
MRDTKSFWPMQNSTHGNFRPECAGVFRYTRRRVFEKVWLTRCRVIKGNTCLYLTEVCYASASDG